MQYIDQIGEVEFPPPYTFPGVTILSFRLDADLNWLLAVSSGQLGRRGCPQVRMELLRANASGLAAKSVSVEQGGPRGCSAVSNAVEM